jgi:hypothetical protein
VPPGRIRESRDSEVAMAQPAPPTARIVGMLNGMRVAQAISVCARL